MDDSTLPSDTPSQEAEFTFRKLARPTLRSALRHGVLSSMSALQRTVGSQARALKRHRVHFLYLHHLYPDEEASFRKLLATLARTHVFLGFGEAVDRILQDRIDQPYIAFSFDDGLKSCIRATQILDEFGAKACHFVCSNMVGATQSEGVTQFFRERLHRPPDALMNWTDLETLLRLGNEIGSHTKSHLNLGEASHAERVDEIGGSREVIEARLGPIEHFSWPYGTFRHISEGAVAEVFAAGYRTCSSAVRGCHVGSATPGTLCIRREHVVAAWPPGHVQYFLARSSRTAGPEDSLWPW